MPNLCDDHFTQLRDKIAAAGLSSLEEKIAATTYDPLATATKQVLTHAINRFPPLMLEPETCVICFFNAKRTPDGRCTCGDIDCKGRFPGSVQPFEKWLDAAVAGNVEYATKEGLL